jgi:hypothetical protein
MKKRTFGDGGDVPPGGRFDSETYKRARAWMAAGSPERKAEPTPVRRQESKAERKAEPSPAPKVERATPSTPPGQIPGAGPRDRAPAATTSERPSNDMTRAALTTAGALGAGAGAVKLARAARGAATTLDNAARRRTVGRQALEALNAPPTRRDLGAEVSAGLRAAAPTTSTARGASRKAFEEATGTAKKARPARKTSGGRGIPAKTTASTSGRGASSARERTRFNSDEKNVEFSSGGSVKGCGMAKKGRGKGKMR